MRNFSLLYAILKTISATPKKETAMMDYVEQYPKHPFAGVCLLLSLVFTLTISACSPGGSTPAPSNRGTATPTGSNSPNTTQTPQVLLGVQPCPDAIKVPLHWDAIVGAGDTDVVVLVTASGPNKQIRVSLSRLEANTNGGIWEATLVEIGTTPIIAAPQSRASITSPVMVKGNSSLP